MRSAVAYYRISTTKPGGTALDLNAQRDAVERFAQSEGITLIASFHECGIGGSAHALHHRPALIAALAAAKDEPKKETCAIIVAKLDRLSPNVQFISSLLSQGVPFIVAEQGKNSESFMLQSYCALAENQRIIVSERAKAALAIAKANGVKLGNPNIALANAKGVVAIKANSDAFARQVAPHIAAARANGCITLRAIAAALNAQSIPTARGGEWQHTTIRLIEQRLVV